jgi:hypothetical protein
VRVAAADLGYESELEFVFPAGLGVFKAGGGLSYHHGGTSLQELVVPVLTFRPTPSIQGAPSGLRITLGGLPTTITNRTFTITLAVEGDLLTTEPVSLRVLLLSDGGEVGHAGMAVGADLDSSSGVLTVAPGAQASLGVMLTGDACPEVRVVVLGHATDAVLAQSDPIPVALGI